MAQPNNTPTTADLLAMVKQLQEELAAAKVANVRKLTLKVGDKGTVNIMGLRKFPIALYPTEITSIFGIKNEIEAFVKANSNKLSMSKSSG